MKFLHTSDWQIGMKADFVGNAAQIVRDERLQILILTCHPELYRALAGAEFFNIESMLI